MDRPTNASRSQHISKNVCCVESCKSRLTDSKRLSFHFPPKPLQSFVQLRNDTGEIEKVDRLDAWRIALDMDSFNPNSRICSLHFHKNDYFCPDKNPKRRYLKRNAVPTLLVPNDLSEQLLKHYTQSDSQENIGCNENIEMNNEFEFVPVENEVIDITSDDGDSELVIRIDHVYSLVKPQEARSSNKFIDNYNANKTFKSVAVQVDEPMQVNGSKNTRSVQNAIVQVDSSFLSPKILDFIENDDDLITMTGIPCFEALDAVVKSVKEDIGEKYDKVTSDMKTQDRIIMTCAKLKHKLSNSLCLIMFRNQYRIMTHSSCQQIFRDMCKTLCNCFRNASPDEITFHALKSLNLDQYNNKPTKQK